MANANDAQIHSKLRDLRKSFAIAMQDSPLQIEARRADLIAHTNSETLDLTPQQASLSLSDEDIKNLAQALKDNTTTKTLNLQSNKNITDKSAEVLLKALENNTTLRTINLDGTKMTEKAKKNFQKKLDAKFALKNPGFFRSLWQIIVNVFSKPKANENIANPPPEAAMQAPLEEAPMQMAAPQEAEMVAPPLFAAPAAIAITPSVTPMAPPPPAPIPEALAELEKKGVVIPDNEENAAFRDSTSLEIMTDPVKTADGQTYDRSEIEGWFAQGKTTSPLTNEPLANLTLTPDTDMRDKILNYLESLKPANENSPPRPY